MYWWANENEIHRHAFIAPLDDPAALAPLRGTGLACVWELEVIDHERRAWLEDVLIGNDVDDDGGATWESNWVMELRRAPA